VPGGTIKRQISRLTPAKKSQKNGVGAGGSVVGAVAEESTEFYSELALAPESELEAAELSQALKSDLVRRWLRRKLYEEVQEQVSHCNTPQHTLQHAVTILVCRWLRRKLHEKAQE